VLDLNQIKPKVKGRSDKYSWNLYNFLNKLYKNKDDGKYIKNQMEIVWLTHSRWDKEHLEFDPNNLNKGLSQLLIIPLGIENCRSFYSLNAVLRDGKSERFALAWKKENLVNITDWFIETYIRDGRCIFDRNHNGWMQGTNNRFTYVNNTRKCNWCGEWHKKEIHKEVTIKRREVWV
jgi:hypothetical protein